MPIFLFCDIEWNKNSIKKNMKSRKVHNCLISIKTLNKCYLKLKIVNGKFLDFQLLNFKLKIVLFFKTILFLFYYFLALCGVQFSVIFSIIKSFAFQFYFRKLQFLIKIQYSGNCYVIVWICAIFFTKYQGKGPVVRCALLFVIQIFIESWNVSEEIKRMK